MDKDAPRQQDEDQLDETIEASFPASDPPANTVETGIGVHPSTPSDTNTAERSEKKPD
jgi:hypothetical protein